MKNLLLTCPSQDESENREVLVRGDHTQSEEEMIQHALENLEEFTEDEPPDEEDLEHQFILDSEAEEKEQEVFLTLQMNRRTDHSYATHYYGEYWDSENTPANGPVGYTDKKTVQ